MTPAARLQAAIEVFDEVLAGGGAAERVLAGWGRAHRFAGSKDRAAIADLVYDGLRRRRSLAWRAGWRTGREDGRAVMLGAAVEAGLDPAALFGGTRHAPAPLDAEERAALAAPSPPPPEAVRLDVPDWLAPALCESLGAAYAPSMLALRRRAPVDLRANLLRTDGAGARAALEAEGIDVVPGPHAATCLRAAPGARITASAAYRAGLVELQDAASQAVAAFAGARPGETVLDYCAGGGGKALALAAAMGGRGRIVAHDAAPARMRDIPERAARAGARIEIAPPGGLDGLEGRCDLVFVDAPCSGSGSWRRDPGGKWRLDPAGLARLQTTQRDILAQAPRFLRGGGRLVFATCSVLSAENDHAPGVAGLSLARRLRLTPADDCDGFAAAVWTSPAGLPNLRPGAAPRGEP